MSFGRSPLGALAAFAMVASIAGCSGSDLAGECSLEPDPWPCRAIVPAFYFDPDSGTCKEFSWGGCEGVVPFRTLEACKQACGG